MSLNRTRVWLLAWAVMFCGATRASAQYFEDAGPFDITEYHDAEPFKRPDLSSYDGGQQQTPEGFFFKYDRLLWGVSPPKHVTIGGDNFPQPLVGPNGVLFTPGNDLTTGFITGQSGWGNRYEGGYVVDGCGWILSGFGGISQHSQLDTDASTIMFNDPTLALLGVNDADGDGLPDDVNGDGVINILDNTYFIPTFARVIIDNYVEMSGLELMRIKRLSSSFQGGTVEWSVGVRYLQIDDTFIIQAGPGDTGTGGILDDFYLNQKVDNHVVGPQIAGRWTCNSGRFRFGTEAKLMAGANFRSIHQDGVIGSERINLAPPIFGVPTNLNPVSFSHVFNDTQFAPTGELRLDLGYQITSALSIKLGYTGIFASGIGRASNTVAYDLPSPQISKPHWGENFMTNGVNLGIEFNR